MRIIAGKLRSRRLTGPPAGSFRPTSDRVREALFNLLGPLDAETEFADIYAGSGAVGIEALSRGAGRVVFVEASSTSCWAIRKNLKSLRVAEQCEVIQKKVAVFLASNAQVFDFVFADPPYAMDVTRVLRELARGRLLKPEGTLILEHTRRQEPPVRIEGLVRTDQRRYGDSILSFYEEEGPDRGRSTHP